MCLFTVNLSGIEGEVLEAHFKLTGVFSIWLLVGKFTDIVF